MLGVVEGQLVRLEPVLEPRDLSVKLTDTHIQAFAGGERIETGACFYVMEEDPGLDIALNRATGEYQVKAGYGTARLRAVLTGGHIDVDLHVERPEPANVA